MQKEMQVEQAKALFLDYLDILGEQLVDEPESIVYLIQVMITATYGKEVGPGTVLSRLEERGYTEDDFYRALLA